MSNAINPFKKHSTSRGDLLDSILVSRYGALKKKIATTPHYRLPKCVETLILLYFIKHTKTY